MKGEKMGVLERILRENARFFSCGEWPRIIRQNIESSLFKSGDDVIVAIIGKNVPSDAVLLPQRQDSLFDQMKSVQDKAVEMGCYDACDWITRNFFAKIEAKGRADAKG